MNKFSKKYNIAFLVNCIDGLGGAERCVCELTSWLAEIGHNILIITPFGNIPKYPIHPTIQIKTINTLGIRENIILLRKEILDFKADLCIMAGWNWTMSIVPYALQGTSIPWIASEHMSPNHIEKHLWNRKDRLAIYESADAIQLLLPSYVENLPTNMREKSYAIGNPISYIPFNSKLHKENLIICIGHLVDNKQQTILVKAFACIKDKYPTWKVELWGEGNMRARINNLILKLGAQNSIFLKGTTSEIGNVYSRAKILCIPSKFEGLPNVVLEAMKFSLPIVGFNDCSGVNDLVIDEYNGILINDRSVHNLAVSLEKLIKDTPLREQMSVNANDYVKRFAPNEIYAQWATMINNVINKNGKTELQKALSEKSSDIAQKLRRDRLIFLMNCKFLNRGKIIKYFLKQFPLYNKFTDSRRVLKSKIKKIFKRM